MVIGKSFWLRAALAASGCLAALSGAHAQQSTTATQAGSGSELEEITVTARKRTEAILNVPVDVQALPASQLQTFQVTELTDLPTLVPGLNFGTALLSIGTLVSIRGVGTASLDPGVDQSVALNIDGLSLGNGLAFNSGLFDIGSVEVLKGPQALFFGKESPGGVISLNTADPTDQLEMRASAAYEFESVQPRAEFIVSGPVTDTLKLRLATMYDQEEGYFYNDAIAEPGTGAAPPGYDRAPWGKESITRITALWDPTSEFSAKLKINEAYDRYAFDDLLQFSSCPSGTAPIPGFPNFIGGGENCVLDRTMREVDLSPAAFPGILNGGTPFLMTDQRYGTLTLHYRPTASQDFSSTTAYYHVTSSSMVNPDDATYAGPFIGVNNRYFRRDFTEEVRDTSDFNGPINYTLGALAEDGKFSDQVMVIGSKVDLGPYGGTLVDGVTPVSIKTRSVFGQLRWDIIDRLELAPGLRWTDEDRTENPYDVLHSVPTPVAEPSLHYNNTSPEATLTWRPTDDLTLYGAYKQGFKSGSFSTATPPNPGANNSFGEEKVRGAEFGLKSRMFDRRLSVNVVPYFYRYEGLQVGTISPPVNGVPIIQTLNAATAHIYGVDLDGAFRPASLDALQINGNAEFNHARYLDFTNAPCWGGQTIALGCNQQYVPGPGGAPGAYTAQNLSGTPLIRAPNVTVNAGFTYTMPVMNDYKLEFSNNNSFTTRYVTDLAIDRPGNDNYQGSFVKIDAGLKLQDPTNFWEVALIAKNINNKVTSGNCASSGYKEGVTSANPSGTNTPSPFGYDAMTCFADPGREIWLRVTVRPFGHGS